MPTQGFNIKTLVHEGFKLLLGWMKLSCCVSRFDVFFFTLKINFCKVLAQIQAFLSSASHVFVLPRFSHGGE